MLQSVIIVLHVLVIINCIEQDVSHIRQGDERVGLSIIRTINFQVTHH